MQNPPVALQIYWFLENIPGLTMRDLEDADPVLIEQLRTIVIADMGVEKARAGAAAGKQRMKAERGW